MESPLVYWAVIREGKRRESYLELEHLGGKKWGAVLGDEEFTFRSDSTDFIPVLSAALTKLNS